MIKLLIADDEPLVQIGIKSMLEWADYGIEICGTAMNGKIALDMIEEYSPEIVITDIKMPIMNGLDLIKNCRETYGSIPLFLILTSYEEFTLIKQALSYQVVDYLVKLELNAETLSAAIVRAKKRLEELQASEAMKRGGGRPLLQSYHDKFFLRLLHNLFESQEQFDLQVRDLKLDFSDRCYLASHGEIHSDTAGQMDNAKQVNLFSSSLQMLREILGRHLPCYVIGLDMRHFCVIFHFPSMEELNLEKIREAWDNACQMVHNYFNVWLTAGLGSAVEDAMSISETYQEARQSFNLADKDHPVIFFEKQDEDSRKNAFNLGIFKTDLTRAFEEFEADILYDTLTEISELFAAHPKRLLQVLDGACSILYLSMSLLPEGEENISRIFSDSPDGYRSIYQMNSVPQVIQWLNTLRDGLCELLRSKRVTYKEHVIANIQKYINNHIEDRLSLNDVAAVFGLSPNYLSTLFKKTCSIGFSEYITQKKIQRAKTLLLEQDLKIYEIADRLGFESAFYFSKVFKKVEGLSPREYLQNRAAEPEEE
ncbi:MAG: AraC family transcriptional regulator [Lachnospiraceae bacterium]|nr:AraC family transcriptional regulator [Lachnospiraceae bacterium]